MSMQNTEYNMELSEMIHRTFSKYKAGTIFGRQSIVDVILNNNNVSEESLPFRYYYTAKKGWKKLKQKANVYQIPYFIYLRNECFIYRGPDEIPDTYSLDEQQAPYISASLIEDFFTDEYNI